MLLNHGNLLVRRRYIDLLYLWVDIVAYSKAVGSTFRSIDEIEDELKKVRRDFEESRGNSMESSKILNKNV